MSSSVSSQNIKDVLCPLPWVSNSFNTDSSLRVCCNTDHGGVIKKSGSKVYLNQLTKPSEIEESDTIINIKKKMLAGVRPEFCRSCYKTEDASGISIRQYYLKKYSELVNRIAEKKDLAHKEKLRFLDFSLTNNCNLKCRMCTPGASYLLSSDFEKLGFGFDKEYSKNAHSLWRYQGLLENLINSEEANELSDILFTGGEPLTNQIHLQVLQDLVKNKFSSKIRLTYHTNLMVLPQQILDLWKNFKAVDVHLSLEGHDRHNDYIRHNSQWSKILQNLETLLAHKKEISLWLEIHTVFQAYNVLILPDFLEFLKSFDSKIPSFPHFIWIDNPSFLSVNSLPTNIKLQALEKIRTYLKNNESFYKKSKFHEFNLEKFQILQSCLARVNMNTNPEDTSLFVDYTKKLDQLRQQDFLSLQPEMREVFL